MWNTLNKLLGREAPGGTALPVRTPHAGAAVTTRTAPAAAPTTPAAAAETPPATHPAPPGPGEDADLDHSFSALLLAVSALHPQDMVEAERRVLQRLEELAAAPDDPALLPRLPAVLPRLMALVRRDDVGSRELAEQLAHDPVLVGEVVRLANSPRLGTGRTISSLGEAVQVVGQRGLHQLVTRAALRPVFNADQGRFSRHAGTRLWAQSERCAHACAWLQGGQGGATASAFSAYLAGMVANAGLIASLRVLDQNWRAPEPPASLGFHDRLLQVSASLSARLAQHWHFPEEVHAALQARAQRPPPAEAGPLSEVLHTADRVSKWHLLAPGLASVGAATAGGPAGTPASGASTEARCYVELERTFGD